MKASDKKRLLITNFMMWAVAVVIPLLMNLIPVSKPPKILPLFYMMFWIGLAVASTAMWNKAVQVTEE